MAVSLLAAAAVILLCVLLNRISNKLGVPMLLAFILLGMAFGAEGPVRIAFSNYEIAEQICSVALLFIMFYGGFGTKWSEARPVAFRALVLSSAGTVLTAALVGLFCLLVLGVAPLESFLIGAVVSSTDAASVFSILRSKRLNLRDNTASMLEIESGSNDPFSYMLTLIVLSLMNGRVSGGAIAYLLFAQIVYGAVCGVLIALLALAFLKRFRFAQAGFDTIFIVAVAIFAYAVPTLLGGNGYLSVYLAGILLGNRRLPNKKALVHFFDGLTGLMQMLLFFLLGLLCLPSHLPRVALPALAIALFLTFAARPAAVFALLSPFGGSPRQKALVSWAGMRGAASIVFAIMAVIDPATTDNDLFHIVFFIVLFSILLQGSLTPALARRLGMTDDESDVLKTFNDYTEEVPVEFLEFTVTPGHPWVEKAVHELLLPPGCLLVLLLRGQDKLVPNGATVLFAGDVLILSGRTTDRSLGVRLYERTVKKRDGWANQTVSAIPSGSALIIMVKRGGDVLIPTGSTVILEGDVLVLNEPA